MTALVSWTDETLGRGDLHPCSSSRSSGGVSRDPPVPGRQWPIVSGLDHAVAAPQRLWYVPYSSLESVDEQSKDAYYLLNDEPSKPSAPPRRTGNHGSSTSFASSSSKRTGSTRSWSANGSSLAICLSYRCKFSNCAGSVAASPSARSPRSQVSAATRSKCTSWRSREKATSRATAQAAARVFVFVATIASWCAPGSPL